MAKKTNTAVELWQLTQNWLSLLGSKPNTKFCREEITTHPDYPAMTAVTDFLDAGNMQYNAVQADASYIHEFNYPLLAHIKETGTQYMHMITQAADWERQKDITQNWSGIVLFPEKNTSWQNAENSSYQKEAFRNKVFAIVFIVAGLALFTASSINQLYIAAIAFGLLSLTGLTISIFLWGAELGYQSRLVKQVCGAVSSGGCEKVLKSTYAKGVWGITAADASVLYFAAQFIFYLLSPYFPGLFNILMPVSILGIPIAGWSIYTQAVKIKEWCALCLAIVSVLVLQAAVSGLLMDLWFQHTIQPLLFFILLIALFTVGLLPLKAILKTNKTFRHTLAELKKWKTDAGLFITQWQQEQQVDTTIWHKDLLLGKTNAPVLITVACNPYCGPCARAHATLDELLNRFPDKLKILIRLLCNEAAESDKRTMAVKSILQRSATLNDNTQLQQMLTDWFAWMDYDKWVNKWQPGNDTDITGRLKEHSNWMEQSAIQFTPTIFINGRKLPGRYNLEDMEYLVPGLAAILTGDSVK